MDIREFTKNYVGKSDAMGAASFFGTIAVYFLSLSMAVSFWGNLLIVAPFVIFLAFSMVRLYVLQHDCGHHSLFATKRFNDWAGYVLSIFSLTPYRVMQYNHNQHHAYLGNLEHRETTEVFTMTLREWEDAHAVKRLGYRIYRNPVVMLGLGGFITYFIAYRWPRNTAKVGVTGVVVHNLMLATYMVLIWWMWGVSALTSVFVAALIAGVIGVFLVYLQHNFEDTYWDKKPDLDFRKATLVGSSSLDLGWLWDLGTGNIAYHDLHHYNPQIPSYRLRRCQQELPRDLAMHEQIGWKKAIDSFRLKLWDEETQRLIPFPDISVRRSSTDGARA